jgi:hypothetical protein
MSITADGERRGSGERHRRVPDASVGVRDLVNSPSLQTRDREKRFTVHGLRKVGIRLQLHLYRAPACEMQRFIRCGVLLRPSPEHRRDHGWWRIFELRSAHSLPRGAGAQKLVKIYVHLRNFLFLGDGPHLLGRGVSARWPKLRGRELAEGARPEFPQLERQWKVATKRQPK